MSTYPPQVYELLQWFVDNWTHRGALGITKRVPEELRLYVEVCQREGLLSPGALVNITDVGRLALRTQGVEADGQGTEADGSKKKPGGQTTIAQDLKTLEEFERGQKDGEWKYQTDYLRKKRPKEWKENQNAAKSTLSQQLKKAREYRKGVKSNNGG